MSREEGRDWNAAMERVRGARSESSNAEAAARVAEQAELDAQREAKEQASAKFSDLKVKTREVREAAIASGVAPNVLLVGDEKAKLRWLSSRGGKNFFYGSQQPAWDLPMPHDHYGRSFAMTRDGLYVAFPHGGLDGRPSRLDYEGVNYPVRFGERVTGVGPKGLGAQEYTQVYEKVRLDNAHPPAEKSYGKGVGYPGLGLAVSGSADSTWARDGYISFTAFEDRELMEDLGIDDAMDALAGFVVDHPELDIS